MSLGPAALGRFAADLAAQPERWSHLIRHAESGGEPRVRHVGPGQAFTVPSTAIHRVLHDGGGPAVTVHAYSPPLTRMGAYRVGAGGELERESLPSEAELQGVRVPAA